LTDSILDFAAFGETLVDVSGKLILNYWRRDIVVDVKLDESPVTIADREAEIKIREMIEKRYPHHGISGEEHGQERMDAEYIWSIDPIDGTKAFISGSPLFGTLIALLKNGTPIMGIIDVPAMGERWVGGDKLSASLNGKVLKTRTGLDLSAAISGSTSPNMFTGKDAERIQRVHDKINLPIYGGDCYLYGMLALGSIDLVIEANLSDYDYLAPTALVTAAGGVVTGWLGESLGIGTTDKIIAAGDKKLHAEVIAILNDN
jgi:histidinol phosphatase-like enzyme (inositol monophosphatase family)